MARAYLNLFALAGIPLIGVTLWVWGQPLICTCGDIQLVAPIDAIDAWQQELNPRADL